MDRISIGSIGTDSQDSDDLVPPGTTGQEYDTSAIQLPPAKPLTTMSLKGIENAKKRLRAFSIQKKTPLSPVVVPKPVNTGSTTVLIGKLSSVKTTPKAEPEPDAKKIPKPPKPGGSRKNLQDSYTALQKRTLADIEDMKRKMELVELGIPLGLICPSSTRDKAMPTKAMPPIKSFLDADKVDEIIREAKKAKAEGREFKFDYQKLLPDYDNPFQRKKDEQTFEKEVVEESRSKSKSSRDRDRDRDRVRDRKDSRKSDKYDRRHSDHKKDDKDKYKDKDSRRDKERSRDKDKGKEKVKEKEEPKKIEIEEKPKEKGPKETDVNLNDYLVCDSWSLDNDDKNTASPNVEGKIAKSATTIQIEKAKQAMQLAKEAFKIKEDSIDSPKPPKIEKLQPVIDSFKFEIDPNEDDALDIFDEDSELEKFNRPTSKKDPYDSPIDLKLFDYDQDMSKEGVIDANDDNFLESVINEIKQENMSDETSQDKGLVEYDISPKDDYDDSKNDISQGSVTPELDDRMRDLQSSQHSHYSDGYRSTESFKSAESGYKSTESGYKSEGYKKKRGYRSESRQVDDFRLSVEKELDEALEAHKMSKSTEDSLETWSFVLKICQPLLFRHDKNKCYKETHSTPKVWYTENPKGCSCVKDRSVVYEELEMCKMALVDRVYGCDQIADEPFSVCQSWYPRATGPAPLPPASEWETEEAELGVKSLTPQRGLPDMSLDREYQKFMEAVWPEVTDPKPADTSRSTTPVRLDARKKKKEDDREGEGEGRRAKRAKLSSEGWSQESDLEEEAAKTAAGGGGATDDLFCLSPAPQECKKIKQEKPRKRKRSSSSESTLSDSEEDTKKKKKMKKGSKKLKAKLAKKRRISKKLKKQLKDKQKKKKKLTSKVQEVSDDTDDHIEKKKEKKAKKKKQLKQKKLQKKKAKAKSSSSSSSSSSSDSESDVERKKKIKKKELEARKKKDKKKSRKQSTDSSQSEELFDVNILNNIKTERLTDDEKMADFSPRRQKPREIINVKELQNDFVGNNIHIKQEKVEENRDIATEVEKIEQATALDRATDKLISEEKPIAHVTCEEKPIAQVVVEDKQLSLEETSVASTSAVEKSPVLQVRPVSPVQSLVQQPIFDDSKPEMEEFIPEPANITLKLEESHLIPLPSEHPLACNLDEIEMPPDSPIEAIKPMTMEGYGRYGEVATQSELYQKEIESECEDKFGDYAPDNYEMYEHMAMAYQSDVANQHVPSSDAGVGSAAGVSRIETVVRRRGEIKCDWRAGDSPAARAQPRPSRWGLKPGEVNIVLTGGERGPEASPQQFRIRSVLDTQYDARPVPARPDNNAIGYDEAYMDMYGAADRLQYGDCFAESARPARPPRPPRPRPPRPQASALDRRIHRALSGSVLGDVAKETDDAEVDKDTPDKGILITKSLGTSGRAGKRVSFADGYTPGQDSDTEEPPVKKKKKSRRFGCAWPCPASHPDHVPLWDALPPPPPPLSPPPPPAPAPPLHLLRRPRAPPALKAPHAAHDPMAAMKIDPNALPFMPPEPPPGIINFQ